MLITKDNTIRFKEFSPAMMTMLNVLYSLNLQKIPDFPDDFVITSANDSTSHSAKSKHYENKALDIRSKNFKDNLSKVLFIDRIQNMLGNKFIIFLENPGKTQEHFHIQVKKGEDYP